jgi:uncharacterized LabA/DUF88 family protein
MSPPALQQKRVIALVDGFNLYHAINDLVKRDDLKWLDVVGLSKAFVGQGWTLNKIFLFTALPPWNQEKRGRHERLLDVYKALGVNVVLGQFREHMVRCKGRCGEDYKRFHEKETDVNIALALSRIAHQRLCEKVLVMTGDTDQVPSVKYAKEMCPELIIKAVIPPFRRANELTQACDENATISVEHLERHQLSDPFTHASCGEVRCPGSWKVQPAAPRAS